MAQADVEGAVFQAGMDFGLGEVSLGKTTSSVHISQAFRRESSTACQREKTCLRRFSMGFRMPFSGLAAQEETLVFVL